MVAESMVATALMLRLCHGSACTQRLWRHAHWYRLHILSGWLTTYSDKAMPTASLPGTRPLWAGWEASNGESVWQTCPSAVRRSGSDRPKRTTLCERDRYPAL